MPVEQVKRGMKGYGLTVFEGTKPTRFDVEIIDVLKNFRPKQDLILIKTDHPRLKVAKVVAGMSGSPIYLNNKMIGAYAYGWTFSAEQVAGVTPIKNMLSDLARPLPKTIHGWPLKPLPKGKTQPKKTAKYGNGASKNRFAGRVLDYDLKRHAKQVAGNNSMFSGSSTGPKPVATPLLMGGMTTGGIAAMKQLMAPLGLMPMQAGGGGAPDPNAPTRFVDGGAVGVQLIRGDMSGMGLGTVTRVEGDKLVAFGHPMMMSGVTALPTAIGRVLWFMASQARSFKLGVPSRPVGALVNDRLASIVVSHSMKAPIFPVTLNIKGVPGAPTTKWKFEVAHEKFMTPSYVAVALGSAMEATAAERQDISWNATTKLKVKGHGEIELKDFGVSVGGVNAGDMFRSSAVFSVGALLNNPWEPAFIEGLSMEIDLRYAREIYQMRGAELLTPEVEPGQSARIRLTFQPYQGKEVTQVVTVPIPKEMAGKTVAMSIVPGYTQTKTKTDPTSVGELVANLEDIFYPPKSVVITYRAEGGGVKFKQHVAENLPPGAMDMLRPRTTSVAPKSFQSVVRHVVPIPYFLTGSDKVAVKVKKVLR